MPSLGCSAGCWTWNESTLVRLTIGISYEQREADWISVVTVSGRDLQAEEASALERRMALAKCMSAHVLRCTRAS